MRMNIATALTALGLLGVGCGEPHSRLNAPPQIVLDTIAQERHRYDHLPVGAFLDKVAAMGLINSVADVYRMANYYRMQCVPLQTGQAVDGGPQDFRTLGNQLC